MPEIDIRDLHKRFGALHVLSGIDLAVSAGEIVVVLGRNGIGKSTVIRVISTLVSPDAGSVSVHGHDVVRERVLSRSHIGQMLGDERAWFWRLTGRHNLEFFGALRGLRKAEACGRAAELLHEAGLNDAADRRVGEYSSGMRLRLGLARALISRPPVLLLDEPTGSLDPEAKHELRDRVRTAADRHETAVLLVTHDLDEAVEIGDRVVILHDGRLTELADRNRSRSGLEAALNALTH